MPKSRTVTVCAFLLAILAVAVSLSHACQITDYHVSVTPCADNTRTFTYNNSNCHPQFFTHEESCECKLEDYVKTYGECTSDRAREVAYTKIDGSDCTGGVPKPEKTSEPCECTADDIASTYSECDTNTNKRTVIYYYKNRCAGGVQLPTEKKELPCTLECKNGEFLAAPHTTCQPCASGYYSFVEGVRIQEWLNWPERMTTYCAKGSGANCKPWMLSGSFVESGDQKDEHNLISILRYEVEIVKQRGSVSFMFKVDSERDYDGLEFYVDGVLKMNRQSWSYNFIQNSYPLTKGFHVLEWRYIKDGTTSKGKDKAFIKSIEVTGTKPVDTLCKACPRGMYSSKGSTTCVPCPLDHYSNDTATAVCKACPEDQYAFDGAVECRMRPQCTERDYEGYYTECTRDGKRKLIYQWLSPHICRGGVQLPENREDIDCGPCPEGMYRDPALGCIGCPDGMVYDESEKKCQSCDKGTAAIRSLVFGNFEQYGTNGGLPSGFGTECSGYCAETNRGWRMNLDPESKIGFLDSGVGYGEIVTLNYTAELYTEGSFSFWWSINTQDDNPYSAYLSFFVNNTLESMFYNTSDSSFFYRSNKYPRGVHTLMWTFEKYDSYDEDSKAILRNIVIEGHQSGAAATCQLCPPGHECPEQSSQFIPCQPGSYGAGGAQQCEKCAVNTFSAQSAAIACQRCGNGTQSAIGASECSHDCTFRVPNSDITYDLRALDREFYGPYKFPETKFDDDDDFDDFFSEEEQKEIAAAKVKHYFNVCRKIRPTSNHCAINDQRYNSYSCAKNKYMVADMGSVLNYAPLDDNIRGGLMLSFTDGSYCIDATGKEKSRSSSIKMICDVEATSSKPVMVSPTSDDYDNEADVCHIQYEWRTAHACPICNTSDYERIEEVCKDGKRKILYMWKSPKTCFGGVPLPPEEEDICPLCTKNDMTTVTSACENGYKTLKHIWMEPRICSDGELLPSDQYFACDEVIMQRNFALIVVGSVAAVILILVAGFLVLYFKHRRLYEHYALLNTERGGLPRNVAVAEEDDDDANGGQFATNAAVGGDALANIQFDDDEDDNDEEFERELRRLP